MNSVSVLIAGALAGLTPSAAAQGGENVAPRKVELGEATGSRIVVLAGLKAGDVTVVRGNERLQPGAAVKIRTGS